MGKFVVRKNISGKGTQNEIHFFELKAITSSKQTTSRTQNSSENVNKESWSGEGLKHFVIPTY